MAGDLTWLSHTAAGAKLTNPIQLPLQMSLVARLSAVLSNLAYRN